METNLLAPRQRRTSAFLPASQHPPFPSPLAVVQLAIQGRVCPNKPNKPKDGTTSRFFAPHPPRPPAPNDQTTGPSSVGAQPSAPLPYPLTAQNASGFPTTVDGTRSRFFAPRPPCSEGREDASQDHSALDEDDIRRPRVVIPPIPAGSSFLASRRSTSDAHASQNEAQQPANGRRPRRFVLPPLQVPLQIRLRPALVGLKGSRPRRPRMTDVSVLWRQASVKSVQQRRSEFVDGGARSEPNKLQAEHAFPLPPSSTTLLRPGSSTAIKIPDPRR